MALSVTSSQNQKTWDATVRVTGGHPLQLWGIGESQAAAEPGLQIDRVVVRDENERMVGYGQLQIRREKVGRNGASLVVAECLNVHSNRVSTIPALLDALAEHSAQRWDAALFSAELDAPSSPELVAAVRAGGWQRTGGASDAEGGPKRLRVNLGSCESDLSARLSEDTLDRCRAGLKVSDVTVREVTERSGDLRAAGLKTEQIGRLLRELGQDSLLLVAAQERPGQEPVALGYLWFVHTVGQAMLYRVGFTRTARELGIDDALLLTGAVELQKRGVQRLDGGDVADPDVPTVVRELADVERTILGPWRKPLGADTRVETAGEQDQGAESTDGSDDGKPAEGRGKKPRRGLFRRARSSRAAKAAPEPAEQPAAETEPERTVAPASDAAADRAAAERRRDVRRQISSDLGVEATDQTPALTTAGTPSSDAGAPSAEGSEKGSEAAAAAPDAGAGAGRSASPKAGKKAARKQAKARKREERAAQAETAETATTESAPTGTAKAGAPGAGAATDEAAQTGAGQKETEPAVAGQDEAAAAGQQNTDAAERTEESPSAAEPDVPAESTGGAETAEPAPVRPVDMDKDKARREREFKAEQRRAERVAQKAEEFESQQKPPREPLGKRLRREASEALRDAMGR